MNSETMRGSATPPLGRYRRPGVSTSATRPAPHPALDLLHPDGPVTGDLLVLPHAGGSPGQYRFLRDQVPAGTRLAIARYPGREKRLGEPFAPTLGHLADEIATAAAGSGIRHPVVFGHSMGGLLAVEVARRLLPDPSLMPSAVVISGRGPAGETTEPTIHTRGDDELVEQIYALGATPPGLLDAPDTRALFLPPVRDDYRLVETYTPSSVTPCPCRSTASPVTATRPWPWRRSLRVPNSRRSDSTSPCSRVATSSSPRTRMPWAPP